ncbi:NAD-dependent epimerase/dehydratase family protein [Candidatus Micrarchaeota archaeon]|nr:NAD-dependent epimerase/dehydratase family protein [Candidatus Micrarchaeota archaeon]
MKTLVTGGAGFIGANLCSRLLEKGWEVIAFDNLVQGSRENLPKNIEFVEGDIRNLPLLEKTMHDCEIVFHIAANFANQRSVDDPQEDLDINGKGTLNVLQASKRNGIKRVVYASSSCVYGPYEGKMAEDLLKKPETPYAITKLLGEYYCKFFNDNENLETVSLRLFNVYGPRDRPGQYRSVIPNFMRMAKEGVPLPIMGDGSDTRDYTFIDDVAEAFVRAAEKKEAQGESINVGSGNAVSVKKLAETILEVSHSDAGTKTIPRRSWDRIRHRITSTEKCKKLLGFTPSVTLEKGLEISWQWFDKTNPKSI